MCLLVYTEDFADDADQGADPGDDASAPAPSTDVRRSDSDDARRRQRRRRRSSSDSDSDAAGASGRTVCWLICGHKPHPCNVLAISLPCLLQLWLLYCCVHNTRSFVVILGYRAMIHQAFERAQSELGEALGVDDVSGLEAMFKAWQAGGMGSLSSRGNVPSTAAVDEVCSTQTLN